MISLLIKKFGFDTSARYADFVPFKSKVFVVLTGSTAVISILAVLVKLNFLPCLRTDYPNNRSKKNHSFSLGRSFFYYKTQYKICGHGGPTAVTSV